MAATHPTPCEEASLRARFPKSVLFHGTTSTLGQSIVADREVRTRALTQLDVTERTGQKYLDSDPSMVYLSTMSAPLYAYSLAQQEWNAHHAPSFPCVVEVAASKLPFDNLYPDEDYVATRLLQKERRLPSDAMPPPDLERRLGELQAEVIAHSDAHKSRVCESVDTLGSLAHKGVIPISSVTRITVMDHPDAVEFLGWAIQALAATQGGFGLSALERALGPLLTGWLLGYEVSPDEFPELMRKTAQQRSILEGRLALKPRTLYAAGSGREVTFRLTGHADARVVALAGSFNDWRASDLLFERDGGGWVYRMNLEPGVYLYKLVIDGHWVPDPENPATRADEAGNVNSILEVPRTGSID